jgi:NADH dehydrogenase FAD-containing subunit
MTTRTLPTARSTSLLRLVIVGGGAGGCELALAMHSRLCDEFQSHSLPLSALEIVLVHKGGELMSQHNKGVRTILTRLIYERGIELHLNAHVIEVKDVSENGSKNFALVCEDGRQIHYDEVIWCTQVWEFSDECDPS